MRKAWVTILLSGLLSSLIATSASAYGWDHHGYYPHHHGYYHHDPDLAAGLVVGGMFGLMAGAAMASPPRYYPEPPVCYKEPVWTHEFCDSYGCYDRTAWRTVCQ